MRQGFSLARHRSVSSGSWPSLLDAGLNASPLGAAASQCYWASTMHRRMQPGHEGVELGPEMRPKRCHRVESGQLVASWSNSRSASPGVSG